MVMDTRIRDLATAIATEVKGKASAAALALTDAAVARVTAADADNRIPNATLKNVDAATGVPAGWIRSGPVGSVSVVNLPQFNGYALQLEGLGTQVGAYSPYFDVMPGEVYNYSARVRSTLVGSTTYVMRIEYTDAVGTTVTPMFSGSTALPAGGVTSSFNAEVTIPPNAVRARAFILHSSAATSGSWQVGEIAFRLKTFAASQVLGNLQYPGQAITGNPRIVTFGDSVGIDGNLYNGNYRLPSGFGLVSGSRTTPVTEARPLLWVQKFSSANRDTNSAEWDQGGGYFALEKRAGDAYGAALTGFGRHESSGGGDLIGVHGRAAAYKAESKVWGGWFYAHAADAAVVPLSIIGIEINLNSRIPDQGYTPGIGYSKGLLVVTQDSSLPVSMGIEIGRGTAAPNGHFHTGLKIRQNSILPSGANTATGINNNEALLIEGSTSATDGANGIRFSGNFRTGVSFAEAALANNAAIVFGENHRIVVGPGAGVSTYLELSRDSAYLNMSGLNLHLNGTKVLGARKTGWVAPTGTASRATFATTSVTLPDLAARVKALIDDLTSHGMIGP